MRSTIVLCLGFAFLPRAAMTQVQLDIVPYVGLYRPTSILASGLGVTLRQQKSIALGMRITKWWSRRLGIEGTVGYAPSPLWSSQYGLTYPAHVLSISAKALLRATPPAARTLVHVGGGVSLISHGGDAYQPWYVGSTTSVAGTATVGAGIRLAQWVAVRLDAEDFVYTTRPGRCTRTGEGAACAIWDAASLTGRPFPTNSTLQSDVVVSFGIALIGRH